MNDFTTFALCAFIAAAVAYAIDVLVEERQEKRLARRRAQFFDWLEVKVHSPDPVDRHEAQIACRLMRRNEPHWDFRGPWEPH